VNTDHDRLCSSPEWAEYIAGEVVPWCLADLDPGKELLELGGGFGAATARLIDLAPRLTIVERDPVLAQQLAQRFPRAEFPAVEVCQADATATHLPAGAFDAAVCFTMLHHVSPKTAQDQLFAEVARLLRPGAWFAGTDSVASERLRDFHDGDIYQPIDVPGLPDRLRAAGFVDVQTEVQERIFRFRCVRA